MKIYKKKHLISNLFWLKIVETTNDTEHSLNRVLAVSIPKFLNKFGYIRGLFERS